MAGPSAIWSLEPNAPEAGAVCLKRGYMKENVDGMEYGCHTGSDTHMSSPSGRCIAISTRGSRYSSSIICKEHVI